MLIKPANIEHYQHISGAIIGLLRRLLLVPEAPVIVVLVCLAFILDERPIIGIFISLLSINFMIRVAALHLARAALDTERYRMADGLSLIALALHPFSADALVLRGAVLLAAGAPAEAAVLFRRATRLLPAWSIAYTALSGALLELGEPDAASAAARQALVYDEHCAVAYLHLAEAERLRGAAAWMIEDRLREGLKVAYTPASEAALRCALAHHLLREQRIAEAMLAFYGAEALLPRCSPANQAGLRIKLGDLLAIRTQSA